MTIDPYREALAELLAAYAEGWRQGAEAGARLCKRKDVKEGFGLLARCFKGRPSREFVLQRCVEAEASHPLHQAVRALALAGALPVVPWVPISGEAGPKRWITRLMLSSREPVVYAVEAEARVSVWSLETSALLCDLALPGGKKTRASTLIELPDGRLRVACSDGQVVERAPGGQAFVKLHALGPVEAGWAASPDLRFHVTRPEFQPVEEGGARVHRIAVHDVVQKTTRELRLPIDYPERAFVWTDWRGGRAAIVGRRSVEVGPDDWREDHSLFLVDPVNASFEAVAFPCELRYVEAGPRPETVRLTLVERDEEGGEETREVDFDLETRAQAPAAESPRADWGSVVLDGGRSYDLRRKTIVDASDTAIGCYMLPDDPHATIGVWDAARGQLVLAGGDPAAPLTIVRPWRPGEENAAPPAAPAPPEPLAWARPGVRLRYEIADFDATDEYTFTVLTAADGLALAIRMGDEEVAAAARFSEAALESATKSVALAQGGADVDLAKEQAKAVPPIVIARASAAKLAAGKSVTWKSEWSEGGKLAGATRGTAVVRVDGAERRVAVLTASNEEVTLTVLDDPRWPLVIERVEGDCHVRLAAIDATQAAAQAAAEPAATSTAPTQAAAGVGAARRFECVEGGAQKFWEVAVEGASLTVRFGKLGAAGTVQTKTLASAEAAAKEAERLIREKTKKGYAPA